MKFKLITVLLLACLTARAHAVEPAPAGQLGPTEVAGVVVDENGQPLAGVMVDAWTWYRGNEVTTGPDGRFHFKGISGMSNRELNQDIVELRFTKTGLSPVYFRSQPLGVGDLSVTMNARTYLEGRVLAIDGTPLPDVMIRADSGPKHVDAEAFTITNVWTETKSDAAGAYRLYVAPDQYKIRVRIPDKGVALVQVEVPANQAVTQDIRLEEGIRFVVKCIDGDTQQPAVGVKVRAPRHKDMFAISDAEGNATFLHMPADKLEINVESTEFVKWWAPDSPNEKQRQRETNYHWSSQGIEVELTPDIQPLSVMLEKGIPVSGRVVDPDGKPVKGAIVVTALTGYGDAIDQTQRFTAKTKDDGSFSMKLPSTGEHQLNLIAHDGGYRKFRKWANGVGEPVQLKPGEEVKDVTLTLTTPGTVKGKVVDSDGVPQAGKDVRVMSADGRDSRYVAPSAKTDAEGNFTIQHVRPGDVRVEVEPFWMNNPDDTNVPAIDHAQVTIQPGGVEEGVTVISTR